MQFCSRNFLCDGDLLSTRRNNGRDKITREKEASTVIKNDQSRSFAMIRREARTAIV